MRMKIAEITIKGDGADLMDLEQRIVSDLENVGDKRKYATHVKRYRSRKGFVEKGKIKVFRVN